MRASFTATHVAAHRRPSKAPVVLEALDPYPPRTTRLGAALGSPGRASGALDADAPTTRASHRTRLSGRQAALGRLQAREARAMMRDWEG